jgi:hypothetical protein
MNNIDVNVTLKAYKINFKLTNEDTVGILKEKIKNEFEIKNEDYDLFCGKYLIDDILLDCRLDLLVDALKNKNFEMLPTTENSYFDMKFDHTDKVVIDRLIIDHNNIITSKSNVERSIELLKQEIEQNMNRIKYLKQEFEQIIGLDDYQEKNALTNQLEKNQSIIEDFKNEILEKKKVLEEYCVKILELKKLEKSAIENVIRNKKLVSEVHKNSIILKKKLNIIRNLEIKSILY